MKKRLTLFFVSLFLCVGTALAQTKVTGTVLSQEDGQPIIGAAVKVVGTSTGMLTNVNGQFTVTLPAGKDQLEVTYLGYEGKTVKAKNGMRIFLKADAQLVDEVVVVAYGTTKKSSFTGSAQNVNSEKLELRPISNVTKGLEGNVSRFDQRQLKPSVRSGWYSLRRCTELAEPKRYREYDSTEGCFCRCSVWCSWR